MYYEKAHKIAEQKYNYSEALLQYLNKVKRVMTMLTYKLLEGSNGTYVYEYYPEGNLTKPGKISISDSGKIELLSLSDNDLFHIYAIHAIHGIPAGKTEGTIAWY